MKQTFKPTPEELKEATDTTEQYGWKVVQRESDKALPIHNSQGRFCFTISKPKSKYVASDALQNKIADSGTVTELIKCVLEQYYYCKLVTTKP